MPIELATRSGTLWAATGGQPFDPALPTVVFLHGSGMDHTVWTQQSRWFAHHGRSVLALDLPGHGRSGGVPPATIAGFAEVVIDALDAAGVTSAALVGHSLGSLIALETAASHADRVRALGLLGAAASIQINPALLDATITALPEAVAMIVAWGFGPRACFGASPSPGLSLTGLARQVLAHSRPGALHTDLTACQSYADGLETGRRVRCPTLVVIGALDRMTPARSGHQLAQAIPGARALELAGVGHMIPMEAPDAVLDALITIM
jgi:pimeloyl-ACP methyl ester carboxylesterase